MRMGPPPYGRSLSQPYQKPLTVLERRLKESGESRRGKMDSPRKSSSPQEQHMPNLQGVGGSFPVPDFSDVSNTFEVTIKRNSLGLGFSIQGGPEAAAPWTNLIRVKKVFPLQPAWETGKLKIGDILLKASGIPLSSLTLRQALDILRSSPPVTVLQVCRTPDTSGISWSGHSPPKSRSNVVRSYSYTPPTLTAWPDPCKTYSRKTSHKTSRPPLPPDLPWPRSPPLQNNNNFLDPVEALTRSSSMVEAVTTMEMELSPASSKASFCSNAEKEWSPDDEENTLELLKPVELALQNKSAAVFGEFVIELKKVNGSLGFTLRQTDDTILRHTVKALVKEPALSDGRIKPGDKLLSANGVDTSCFTHKELIQHLRQCPETCVLKLYRDASRSQTPLSPDISHQEFFFPGQRNGRASKSPSRGKHLRYEAAEMVRSLQASRTSLDKAGLCSNPGSYASTGTLGRRLGRPYSPAMKDKLTPSSPQPQVESPMSPTQYSSAPASLSHQVTQSFGNLVIDDRLRIEEVECCDNRSIDAVSPGGCGTVEQPQTPGQEEKYLRTPSHEEMHYLRTPGQEDRNHLKTPGQEDRHLRLTLPNNQEIHQILLPSNRVSSVKSQGRTNCTSNGHSNANYIIETDGISYSNRAQRPNDLNLSLAEPRKQGFIFNADSTKTK